MGDEAGRDRAGATGAVGGGGLSSLVVPQRFRGPTSSGNGGWTAGAAASLLDPGHGSAVTITLRQPPPLDTAMDVVRDERGLVVARDGDTVLEAAPADHEPGRVDAVPAEEARDAEATYPGLVGHPFPECFVCGTGRAPGDGLRIFPGRVSDQDGLVRAAATWTPHASLTEDWHEYAGTTRRASLPVTWAALDCVGAWAADMTERLMVLGRMTARIGGLPAVGEEHVVVGLARGSEGRKHHTAAAVFDARGELVGAAEHVWITVDRAAFA